jgi:hypothetical protein
VLIKQAKQPAPEHDFVSANVTEVLTGAMLQVRWETPNSE